MGPSNGARMPLLASDRDTTAFAEVARDRGKSRLSVALRYAVGWFLERLAGVAPIPSWRAALHRLRGVRIGRNVYIGYDVIFDRLYPERITIEDYAEIGDRCIITAHQRGSLLLRKAFPREIKPVTIKRGAWVMPGVIIVPGITIEEFGIVATGAVVNKDVPSGTLVGGVPAKVIRKLDLEIDEPAAES